MTGFQSPVAIVGIAAELPSGQYSDRNFDHKSFFEFLCNKGESYETIPGERFNIDAWSGRSIGQVIATKGSFLKEISMFDHLEFGINAKDAKAMSVSTRKLIELSFLALLDSGINYRGRNVGCYTSGVAFDIMSIADPDEFETRGSFSGAPSMIANRISYHLDLTGPSIPTDTACSSSLTAMHLAVQALRSGECEAAVVGGCQINHRLVDYIQYSQGSVLAPDGKCKPFDASANGFARAEGAVVVVLKMLQDAIRDGDHIYASILGTGINSTGSVAPANAPVADAQADAMRRAYRGTGRSPNEVDFVELHATGTAAGDPVEANWVGSNFRREDEILIGSVKGNTGHLEIAAFLVSLSKVISILATETIPPNVNLRTPNPAIRWKEHKLKVPLEPTPLRPRAPSGRALISLCSSGIGGANGHAVLEGPPLLRVNGVHTEIRPLIPCLLVAGGLTPRATTSISEILTNLAETRTNELDKFSAIYGRRARQATWRAYSVVEPGKTRAMRFVQPSLSPRVKPPIVFVFSGQGPQHINMGRQLFEIYPVFRESVLDMDRVYQSVTGYSLIQQTGLFQEAKPINALPDIWPIATILPSLAIIQMALFDLLRSVGVQPNIIVGHSAGETAALYASGAASRDMAVELAIARGNAMTIIEQSGGTMAALACGAKDAQSIIDAVMCGKPAGLLEIACYNSHEAVAIAGTEINVSKAVELAQARGVLARRIKTHVPVHSSLMDACIAKYCNLVGEVFARYPGAHIPLVTTYSTLTGAILDKSFTADYFWENTRHPVLFTQATSSILSQFPNASFVEISPHPALSSYITALGASASSVTCPMRRAKTIGPHDEVRVYLESLGRLITMGHNNVEFLALNGSRSVDNNVDLPPYPFAKKQIPYYPSHSPVISRQFRVRNGPLNDPDLRINALTHPDIAQHVIKGEPIMPAAGFLEMAFEFRARTLWNVNFRSMLSLSGDNPFPVHVNVDGLYWSVESNAPSSDSNGLSRRNKNTRLHADGFLSLEAPSKSFPHLDVIGIRMRCQPYDLLGFYEELAHFANYGPIFQRLMECYRGNNEVLVKVRGVGEDLLDVDRYVIHPAILDSCAHVMVHPNFTANLDPNVYYLPSRVDLVVVHERLAAKKLSNVVYSHAIFRKWLPDGFICDFIIADEDGERLCTLEGFSFAMHRSSWDSGVKKRFDFIYQPFDISPLGNGNTQVQTYHTGIKELYEALDNVVGTVQDSAIAMRCELGSDCTVSRNYSGLRSLWPEYFAVTDGLEFEGAVTVKNFTRRPAFLKALSPSIIDCVNVFQRVLTHIVNNCGKKVVRILEVGAGTGCLTHKLTDIINSFLGVEIVYFVSDISLEAAERVCPPSGMAITFDPSKPFGDQAISAASFDIIIGFHTLSPSPRVPLILSSLCQLLLPGGTLIFGELDEVALRSDALGSIWLNTALDAFGYYPTKELDHSVIKSLPMWRQWLSQAGSGSVTTYCDHDQDPFFFVFSAQLPPLPSVLDGALTDSSLLIVPFAIGQEMNIQGIIANTDEIKPTTLWITALKGPNADAALGFSRSLRREVFQWDIRLVTFDADFQEPQQRKVICRLSQISNLEPEVLIDAAGHIHVPRFVTSAPPMSPIFDSSALWTSNDTKVVQVSTPVIPPDHVLVGIESMSIPDEGLRGIVGRILDPGQTGMAVGARVISITYQTLSNFAIVHEGALAMLNSVDSPASLASLSIALAIGPLSLGFGNLDHVSRLKTRRILVIHNDSDVGKVVVLFYRILGLNPHEIAPTISAVELSCLQIRASDIIVTGCIRQNHLLKSFTPSGTRVFSWNEPVKGIPDILSNDPWSIGEALQGALARIEGKSFGDILASRKPEEYLPRLPRSVESLFLFDPKKSYLLIGGIGSLGLQIALWMYQKGARNLILTSRSGRASLVRAQNHMALRVLSYLETLSDLSLRLEMSDATCGNSMATLVNGINPPIAGCILLSMHLSDRTFLLQTAESFAAAFAPKLGAFGALEGALSVEKLDFLITTSSAMIFGNAGQTTYASANTAMDGKTFKYRNAFSLIVPPIIDSGIGIRRPDNDSEWQRLQRLLTWGIVSRQLCECIEDGIRKLANGRVGLYIPDLNWDVVQQDLGPSTLYDHLLKRIGTPRPATSDNASVSLKDIVLGVLDVSPQEFCPDIPFTAYGLDSLSSARLAFAIRGHISISQLQLLGDVCLLDLEKRIEKGKVRVHQERDKGKGEQFDWKELHKSGHTLVKLTDYGGVPLILVHGVNGSILPFNSLQERFSTSIWAIQMTPETPTGSVAAMTAFYYEAIKAARPTGPYRLGGFSASSVITLSLALLFEANGDTVAQLSLIDHIPFLFSSPLWNLDEIPASDDLPSRSYIWSCLQPLINCYRSDSSSAYQQIAEELVEASNGAAVRAAIRDIYAMSAKVVTMTLRFIAQLAEKDMAHGNLAVGECLMKWGKSLRAPVTVYVASRGMVASIPSSERDGWEDLGAHKAIPNSTVAFIDAGHFDMFEAISLLHSLQHSWTERSHEVY